MHSQHSPAFFGSHQSWIFRRSYHQKEGEDARKQVVSLPMNPDRSFGFAVATLLFSLCCINIGHVRCFTISRHRGSRRRVSSTDHTPPPPLVLCAQLRSKSTQTSWVIGDVGSCIGSGSYGTVHWITLHDDGQENVVVGKRAWTKDELAATLLDKDKLLDKTTRCRYYFRVEQHCLEKMTFSSSAPHPGITQYLGTARDADQHAWMLFRSAGEDFIPLDKLMAQDKRNEVLLEKTSQALLGTDHRDPSTTLVLTLDTIMTQLLEIASFVHSHSIVHRDIKPSNLLVSEQRLVLIDFGSAADLDTAGLWKDNIGLGSRVAISPIYAAPEIFVDPSTQSDGVKFDCFSIALLYCQFLFQYLEDRKESGFHQQLEDANWDLDAWLRNALQSKVRPTHLDEALEVLRQRSGLWKLLQDMLEPDPRDRVSSAQALAQWREIQKGTFTESVDGPYLQKVLASLEQCNVFPTVHPLHFVATFRRSESLGLVLAEYDADVSELAPEDAELWNLATREAQPGEVFVQGIVPLGQADTMGIFNVGDRLHGIGELPFQEGGFERAVDMLQDQPRTAKYITLHFDRLSVLDVANEEEDSSSLGSLAAVVDQGAWSVRGRRKGQEDAFLLHVVNDTQQRSVLLLGVLDGHLGAAASNFVRDNLPMYFSSVLNARDTTVEEALSKSWQECCDAYRLTCQSDMECTAEYDPKEGTLLAYTGSEDAVAGSTATIFAIEKNNLIALNCGDSRGLIMNTEGKIVFKTRDHTPEREMDRLVQGNEMGLPYSIPQCNVNKWTVAVGDYDYAVARSLEGTFATSRGIVSEPDVHKVQMEPGNTIVLASDGLFEVIDSMEVCRVASRLQKQQLAASDVAKSLVSLAYERGSSDNISVVVVCLA